MRGGALDDDALATQVQAWHGVLAARSATFVCYRSASFAWSGARLEEVEKAKFKIDELHKNYYALQSSQKAAEAGPAKEVEQKKEMRLNRSKQHAYAFTGLYRP